MGMIITEKKQWLSAVMALGLALTSALKAAEYKSEEVQTDHITVDLDKFPGGVAIWYLLPEAISTVKEGSLASANDNVTGHTVHAVHVHARETKFGKKLIDESFKQVTITSKKLKKPLLITTEFAQQHFLASVNKEYDLDKQTLEIIEKLNSEYNRELVDTNKSVHVSKEHCPGGYQIFSFNQSLLWTAPRPEEKGIHVHCFRENGTMKHDWTFSEVWVEGRKLTVERVREYAVEKELFRTGMLTEEPKLEVIFEN